MKDFIYAIEEDDSDVLKDCYQRALQTMDYIKLREDLLKAYYNKKNRESDGRE